MSILLLGASGYIGSAIRAEIVNRNLPARFVSRSDCDYTDEETFRELVCVHKPEFVINSAAYVPTPSVDMCSVFPDITWEANVALPAMLAQVCGDEDINLCHISTGCLYDQDREYSEDDFPTRLMEQYCKLYIRTKFYAEQLVSKLCAHYIWRIRIPFDHIDHPRNYLTKLSSYNQVWSHTNSLTHRGDFAKVALDMIESQPPFGTYHMVNRGSISAREILDMMDKSGLVDSLRKQIIPGPVTGSTLSTAKLEATGVKIRHVRDAIEDSIRNWKA